MTIRDIHIHLERGSYTTEWVEKFIDQAVRTGMDEIWILEHTHRFQEFMPIYEHLKVYGIQQSDWVSQKGTQRLDDYICLMQEMKKQQYPVRIRWGLEVCYFPGTERFVEQEIKPLPFDFLVGSVHWIDGFGFDQERGLWKGVDVNNAYKRYYEIMKALIRSGLFDGLAHPDSIKCYDYLPNCSLTDTYHELAALLNQNHMYAEQSNGLVNNYGYWQKGMNQEMLKIFANHKVRLESASDAHRPEDVGRIF